MSLPKPVFDPLPARADQLVLVQQVMDRLLAPDGCPWDHKQTLDSLKQYLIEEAYEVVDAVDDANPSAHCEELGDVLFQIVFQAALQARQGLFNLDDVCRGVAEKMRRRHPHVFGETTVQDADEVARNWEALKAQEKTGTEAKRRLLDGIPRSMPALCRGQRIADRAAATGFDWPDLAGVREKIDEELAELDAEIEQGTPNRARMESELGDVLFTLTRLAGKLGLDAEQALRRANDRFVRRFYAMQDRVSARGETFSELPLAEMNRHWNAAKRDQAQSETG